MMVGIRPISDRGGGEVQFGCQFKSRLKPRFENQDGNKEGGTIVALPFFRVEDFLFNSQWKENDEC